MSRIGKQPIDLPEKVEVKIDGLNIVVKGPKGQLERSFSELVNIKINEKKIEVSPVNEERSARGQWGLARTLLANMVQGVTSGFEKKLEFTGVGYRAQASGDVLNLNLGYSHPIEYKLPEGVSAKVEKNQITISGSNKELIGLVAAKVRSFRPPEPYKGKGIKYSTEKIIRKAGKSGAKK